MRTSATANLTAKTSLERMITTDMSVNIVSRLLKQNWTMKRIAETIGASVDFIERLQDKKHVFTWNDLRRLSRKTGETPELMFLNSVDVRPGLEPLFESVRRTLELAAIP